jgi:pyoverdine/dityrosine biosynthesis protein Dit1
VISHSLTKMSYSKRLDIDAILAVLRRFGRSEKPEDGQAHESVKYEEAVASKVHYFHESGQAIQMLLPAAPFKNPCKEKVLDTKSPDFAEELGLSRLNHLCRELEKVYSGGAEVTMVSDGPVYNGIVQLCTFTPRDVPRANQVRSPLCPWS